ncbi:MAG TPA: hypothetical protein VL181_07555 [Holophagaceae bacterium]|jgi:hypothetical protein|nr:hypothetical protein [Holophagaceae bacterium]
MIMRRPRPALLCLVPAAMASQAQALPFDQMAPADRAMAEDILHRANFDFTSRTEPKRVKLATMEKLFNHPRMSVAMWRQCQFVPAFHAVEISSRQWKLDDTQGLRADLRLIYAKPGWRIYLVDGTAAKGRLGTPFAVSARMVASYRYWQGDKGFESEIHTWTALDSALLGFVARPFYGHIKSKQDQFIAYINGNIASFGEAADLAPGDFLERLRQEGDEASLRAYQTLFEARR